jgi:two-component system cell cycle response regulator
VDTDDETRTRVTRFSAPVAGASGQACLVVIHAALQSELGRRYVVDKPVLSIGRGRDNDIVLSSDAVSRRHNQIEQRGAQIFVVDLESTNGTFINDDGRLLEERCLNRGDLLKIGDTIFKYLSGSDVEAQYHEVIFRMAVTDGLTNLCNRQQLDTLLYEEIARAQRQARELSLLMIDIDYFKRVNDSYGHLAGDSVLRGVASILQKRLRPTDRLGRYGGEEFCALLPDTALQDAVTIAEELRSTIEGRLFAAEDRQVKITISIGVAGWRQGFSRNELYGAADSMLYTAKRNGRNRVCY